MRVFRQELFILQVLTAAQTIIITTISVQLSDRLASFGIIGNQLRAHLGPRYHHGTMISRGSRGGLNWAPITPRGVRLSNSRCNVSQCWRLIVLCKCGGLRLRLHTEKSFRNLIESTRNQIVFTIFWLIWIQTDSVRLVPNHSENGKYNLISGWFHFNKIAKRFICVCTEFVKLQGYFNRPKQRMDPTDCLHSIWINGDSMVDQLWSIVPW